MPTDRACLVIPTTHLLRRFTRLTHQSSSYKSLNDISEHQLIQPFPILLIPDIANNMEHPSFTMAGLCGIGGLMGFYRKGSMPSLIGGLTCAALYGTAGYLLKQNADWGLELAIGTSALLTAGMLPRAIKTVKPVPIAVTLIGGISTGYYIYKYKQFY